jgi:hypothetical protein
VVGSEARSIDELIDAVPWGRLALAYGFALDAPAMLHGQVDAVDLDPDFDDWVFSSVIHQGKPYSGTAPTLWLLRRIVEAHPGHPALGTCLRAVAECAAVLSWVRGRGDDANDDTTSAPVRYRSPGGDPLWSSVLPPDYVTPPNVDGRVHDDYFMAATAHLDTLTACVAEWRPTVAACLVERSHLEDAVDAGSAVVQLWPTGSVADALVAVVGDNTVAEQHRAGALYALSRAGNDVTDLVNPTDRGLHFAIALGQPDRATYLEALVDALGDLPWLFATFPHGLPGAKPWLLAAVIATVLDRTPVNNAGTPLVDALAGVLARPSGPLGATYEWGPVLAWAFPDRVQKGVVQAVPLPQSLTPLQNRLLAALVGNDKVWTPKSGNDSLALRRVGLPHDRAVVAGLLRTETPPKSPERRWHR